MRNEMCSTIEEAEELMHGIMMWITLEEKKPQ